jgi:hypothetical protein
MIDVNEVMMKEVAEGLIADKKTVEKGTAVERTAKGGINADTKNDKTREAIAATTESDDGQGRGLCLSTDFTIVEVGVEARTEGGEIVRKGGAGRGRGRGRGRVTGSGGAGGTEAAIERGIGIVEAETAEIGTRTQRKREMWRETPRSHMETLWKRLLVGAMTVQRMKRPFIACSARTM